MNDSKVDKNISTNLIIKYCLAIKILAVTLATVKNNDATAHIMLTQRKVRICTPFSSLPTLRYGLHYVMLTYYIHAGNLIERCSKKEICRVCI